MGLRQGLKVSLIVLIARNYLGEKKKNHDHDRHYHPNEVPIAMRQLNFET